MLLFGMVNRLAYYFRRSILIKFSAHVFVENSDQYFFILNVNNILIGIVLN